MSVRDLYLIQTKIIGYFSPMKKLQTMNNLNTSMTKGFTLIVETGGMVSLIRSGKSRLVRHSKAMIFNSETGRVQPTKARIPEEFPGEDARPLEMKTNMSHTVHHINGATVQNWLDTLPSMHEQRLNNAIGAAFHKLSDDKRITAHINDFVSTCHPGRQVRWYIQNNG